MDFTLPVLQRTGGLDMVPAAIVHGFILSLLVPILIAFFPRNTSLAVDPAAKIALNQSPLKLHEKSLYPRVKRLNLKHVY